VTDATPLLVDLDGTLLRTDMLHESALFLLRDQPGKIFLIPYWLSRGKAFLKERLAALCDFDPAVLPYRQDFLDWLRQQRALGRTLILCTASDQSIAKSIARHLGIFDSVIASDGVVNLSGENKASALVSRFGERRFDYAANAHADLAVWRRARHGIVVSGSDAVRAKAQQLCTVERTFATAPVGWRDWLRLLRVHQWLKNLLLLVPAFAAHQLINGGNWQSLLLAFLSFSLCASAVYIANDLVDLESDRKHARKRHRPLASSAIPPWMGVTAAPLLILLSLLLALQVGGSFFPWLLFYFVLTCAYSLGLKRVVLVDCLTLAMLYTLRIVAGASAAGLSLSFWLLAFSVFLFLSLAFLKRYAELQEQTGPEEAPVHGRGYYGSDASLVQMMGITSGYATVVVLALYLNSDAVLKLYKTPEFVWGAVPVMLFWISWIWMQAHRGDMHDDPLIFAIKDKASLMAGGAFAAVLMFGALGWPW
jgi:4-hydroxybenzoate polyprenyltransferase/phosphoserine phosphatase